jgi:Fe-S-cluster-containing hydrogenase component 2
MSIPDSGIPTKNDLKKVIPPSKVLGQGPVVIVECFQNIPCDPCAASCPSGAIRPFEDINNLPLVDYTKCTGCGLCIASCPGLAIFVVDVNYSNTEALIKLPYELLPIPQKGQTVSGLDRAGRKVADVKVIKVLKNKNKTNVVSILVPKDLAMVIRNISVEEIENG